MAIHHALCMHRSTPDLHILTDSLGSIQKIIAQLQRPRSTARCHHLQLLQAIVHELLLRDNDSLCSTSIRKVPAHAGVPGNEAADQGAKDVVKAHGNQHPDTFIHRLGANPHRLPVWAFATPLPLADVSAPALPQEPRAFTSVKLMRKYVTPLLGMYTSRPSQYRNLFQHIVQEEGPSCT